MFSITCTTCQARLKVRDEAAVGSILPCPKCGSLVQIVRPAPRPDGEKSKPADHNASAANRATRVAPAATTAATPPGPSVEPHVPAAPLSAAANVAPETAGEAKSPAEPPLAEPVRTDAEAGESAAQPEKPEAAASLAESHAAVPCDAKAAAAEQSADAADASTTVSGLAWRRWIVLAGSPFAGLLLMLGLLFVCFSSEVPNAAPQANRNDAVVAAAKSTESDKKAEPAAETLPNTLTARWLPDETRFVFSLAPGDLAGQSGAERLLEGLGPCWTAAIGPAMKGLGLELHQIGRVTLAATDVNAMTNPVAAVACSLIAIRLESDVDPERFISRGTMDQTTFGGAALRRLPGSPWPHRFVVLPESRTILTGPTRLLQQLENRGEPCFTSRAIARLVETARPASNLIAMLDLTTVNHNELVHRAGRLCDVWAEGRSDWQAICNAPEGLGLGIRWTEGLQAEVSLVCPDKTAAAGLDARLAVFLPTAKAALADRIRSLSQQPLPQPERPGRLSTDHGNKNALGPPFAVADEINRRWSDRYEVFLQHLTACVRGVRRDVVDDVAWIRASCDSDPVSTLLVALEAVEPARADWLRAGLSLDRDRQENMLHALDDCCRTQGVYPEGAVGSYLLSPQTRLSWMATLLPYQEHRDWHRRLQFGYSWNSEQNMPVTRRTLPEAVNPTLGPSETEDGFPVTHYVGVAGLGRDAGRLGRDDPRAGVFGFSRSVRPEDIADGSANTIAVLGVSDRLGPWSAGGRATVRGLTQRPYVNGPDGFGSGQPQGMLAGMADGSARFISKDVDPLVLEQMVTVAGNSQRRERVRQAEPTTQQQPDAVQGSSAEPLPADVAARLGNRLLEVEFADTPLADVIELLAAMTALEIELDRESLSRADISTQIPITLQLSGASAAEILDAVLAPNRMQYVFRDGRLLVRSSLH